MSAKYIAPIILFKLVKQADPEIEPLVEPNRTVPVRARICLLIASMAIVALVASCGEGLVVPEEELAGAIAGTITYVDGAAHWPPYETIFDLRFVAMRFIPVDTADFLQLNRMAISNSLPVGVGTDTFFIADVTPGTFPYSGVAYRFSEDIFDWKPVGVYTENDGIFTVRNGETTLVSVVVDFRNPPTFPPEL